MLVCRFDLCIEFWKPNFAIQAYTFSSKHYHFFQASLSVEDVSNIHEHIAMMDDIFPRVASLQVSFAHPLC